MNPKHLEILQHALGADQYGQMPKYGADRNYYGTDPYDLDCIELVQMGYMVELPARSWLPDTMFAVTESGKEAMKLASSKPPKVTRSQKRYQDFLDASDAWNCTFREYLDIIRTDWYKDMKGQDAGR
jgi:hypothetical protein